MRNARAAYTLLELMLVLAILVIMAALAYPSLDGMYGYVKLRAGADGVRGAFMQARAHAMDEGRPYRFAVVPGQGNYRVAPDIPGYWGGGDAPAPADPANPPAVIEDALPKGIRFTLNGAGDSGPPPGGDTPLPPGGVEPGMWARVVTFLPDGTATDDVQITIQAAGVRRPLVLRLRALTGAVTVQGQ